MFSGKLSLGVLTLTLAGCGLTESKDNLANFEFEELVGQQVEAAMDATGAGRQVLFLGQTPTPNRCYELRADLTSSGSTVTVTVTARSTNSTCTAGQGAFRYTGNIEMARGGTYHFTVRHVFPTGTLPMTTFTKDVMVQ